jgi:serine protease Do
VRYEMGGAHFEDLPYRELSKMNLDGGVRVGRVDEGKWKRAGVEDQFIITHLDKVPVDNVEDLNRILRMKNGGMLVEGINADGEKGTYGVDW